MISKEKFEMYEYIRQSGLTNMIDVKTVSNLSGGLLSRDDCFEIMKNYGELREKYLPDMNTGGGGGVDE